jgi:hypothetical protein
VQVHYDGPCKYISTKLSRVSCSNSHKRPADERDQDHRQPGRHLGKSPEDPRDRDSQVVLLKRSVEGVEDALVRRRVLELTVNNELLDGLGGGRCAVQGEEARSGGRSGLVGQRLGDGKVVDGWRADGPRVAENWFIIAVENGELGSVGLRGKEGKGSLVAS